MYVGKYTIHGSYGTRKNMERISQYKAYSRNLNPAPTHANPTSITCICREILCDISPSSLMQEDSSQICLCYHLCIQHMYQNGTHWSPLFWLHIPFKHWNIAYDYDHVIFTVFFLPKRHKEDAGCSPILSCDLEALASIMVRIKDALVKVAR